MSTTETPPTETPAAANGNALFDKSAYETEALQLPKIDGQAVDKIAVAFTGRILLNRSNEADVALFRAMQLGKDVELRIEGKVKATGGGFTTNREGDLDAVVAEKTIKVDSLWLPVTV